MYVKQSSLLNFMKDMHQLYVPIFQKRYSWNIKECNQLLNDILKIGSLNDSEKTHFIGSIIYIKDFPVINNLINSFMIIDGQQRITTITLLISALALYLKEHSITEDNLNFESLFYQYLVNNYVPKQDKNKLLLNGSDKRTLIKIVNNLNSGDVLNFNSNDSVNIMNNFNYFMNNISKENFKIIFNGLNKLNIIQISLEEYKDNPQLIYESFNSTGLELSNIDLIRNYVLMTFSTNNQEIIYKKYWKEMEISFEGTKLFERFLHDYLTIHLNHIPIYSELYQEFKDYSFKWDNMEDLLKDINKYFKYYLTIALSINEDHVISESFKNFNQLKTQVTYPFLLQVYKDYMENEISKNLLLNVLNIIESYLFRRSICNIPTYSLNKTFASLYNTINKRNYIESLKAQLIHLNSYKRYPTDEEFRKNLINQDMSNSNNILYLLSNLEANYHPKTHLKFNHSNIEHILPQNPNISKEWMKSLGPNYQEIYENYVNNLGNLTLTNTPLLSNLPFEEKQKIPGGFKDSIFCLNQYLTYLPNWDEEEIIRRAEILADLAIQVWPYPEINKKTLKNYTPKKLKNPGEYDKNLQNQLLDTLEKEIFKLGKDVKKNPTLTCTAFKTNTNFIYTYTQTDGIKIELLMPKGILKDPKNKVKILPKIEYNNKVTYFFKINSIKDISYAMFLIKQSYDYVNSKDEFYGGSFDSNDFRGTNENEYSLDSYKLLHYHLDLFKSLENEIYGLGEDIERKFNRHYIAFKSFTNFVDITPQKGALRITLNMPFSEVNDPKGIGGDITNVKRWENGDFFFKISSINGLDYAMFLIKQSYDYVNSMDEINNDKFSSNNTKGKEEDEYSLDSYKLLHYNLELFESLEKQINNLGDNIERKFNKHYITYKSLTVFVDIIPQKNSLKITINMPFAEVNDPKKIGEDVSGIGHLGNGGFRFKIYTLSDLDYTMYLIKQSYEYILQK